MPVLEGQFHPDMCKPSATLCVLDDIDQAACALREPMAFDRFGFVPIPLVAKEATEQTHVILH